MTKVLGLFLLLMYLTPVLFADETELPVRGAHQQREKKGKEKDTSEIQSTQKRQSLTDFSENEEIVEKIEQFNSVIRQSPELDAENRCFINQGRDSSFQWQQVKKEYSLTTRQKSLLQEAQLRVKRDQEDQKNQTLNRIENLGYSTPESEQILKNLVQCIKMSKPTLNFHAQDEKKLDRLMKTAGPEKLWDAPQEILQAGHAQKRDRIERKLFQYDDSAPYSPQFHSEDRPIYFGLNLKDAVGGAAPQYGGSYFIGKTGIYDKSTLTPEDTFNDDWYSDSPAIATPEVPYGALLKMHAPAFKSAIGFCHFGEAVTSLNQNQYLELQALGINWDDISTVVIDRGEVPKGSSLEKKWERFAKDKKLSIKFYDRSKLESERGNGILKANLENKPKKKEKETVPLNIGFFKQFVAMQNLTSNEDLASKASKKGLSRQLEEIGKFPGAYALLKYSRPNAQYKLDPKVVNEQRIPLNEKSAKLFKAMVVSEIKDLSDAVTKRMGANGNDPRERDQLAPNFLYRVLSLKNVLQELKDQYQYSKTPEGQAFKPMMNAIEASDKDFFEKTEHFFQGMNSLVQFAKAEQDPDYNDISKRIFKDLGVTPIPNNRIPGLWFYDRKGGAGQPGMSQTVEVIGRKDFKSEMIKPDIRNLLQYHVGSLDALNVHFAELDDLAKKNNRYFSDFLRDVLPKQELGESSKQYLDRLDQKIKTIQTEQKRYNPKDIRFQQHESALSNFILAKRVLDVDSRNDKVSFQTLEDVMRKPLIYYVRDFPMLFESFQSRLTKLAVAQQNGKSGHDAEKELNSAVNEMLDQQKKYLFSLETLSLLSQNQYFINGSEVKGSPLYKKLDSKQRQTVMNLAGAIKPVLEVDQGEESFLKKFSQLKEVVEADPSKFAREAMFQDPSAPVGSQSLTKSSSEEVRSSQVVSPFVQRRMSSSSSQQNRQRAGAFLNSRTHRKSELTHSDSESGSEPGSSSDEERISPEGSPSVRRRGSSSSSQQNRRRSGAVSNPKNKSISDQSSSDEESGNDQDSSSEEERISPPDSPTVRKWTKPTTVKPRRDNSRGFLRRRNSTDSVTQ